VIFPGRRIFGALQLRAPLAPWDRQIDAFLQLVLVKRRIGEQSRKKAILGWVRVVHVR
jgi:hypothetical protein